MYPFGWRTLARLHRTSAPFAHLLFEVAPLLFVDQHQVQVVAHRELLVDVPHRGGQVVASQEQPDGYGLA